MLQNVTLNFDLDDSQGNHNYNMILSDDVLSKFKKDLCLYDYTIWVNESVYEGRMTPMEDIEKSTLTRPPIDLIVKSFRTNKYVKVNMYWMQRGVRATY